MFRHCGIRDALGLSCIETLLNMELVDFRGKTICYDERMYIYRDRNKEKFLHVRRTCDHVRLTCPPIFSHVQKIMHRSTQNYKFRKTGTILNYSKWLFFREFCLGD